MGFGAELEEEQPPLGDEPCSSISRLAVLFMKMVQFVLLTHWGIR